MIIILSGGGDAEQIKKTDTYFISLIHKDKKILYIPIAKKTRSYKRCLEWIKFNFKKLKFNTNKIVMWTNIKNRKLKDLEQFGGIYIGGGNTFSLLKDLKDSDFIKLLKSYIKGGGIVYGGSAGAMILGRSILTASYTDKNYVNLKVTSGMDLLKKYSVYCHFRKKDIKNIKNLQKEGIKKILALPEGSGAVLKEGKLIKIGSKKIYRFN